MDKPKTNYLNLFLIFSAFILFSVCVYFIGKQSVMSLKSIPSPTSTLPTQIPTTNLKSFSDQALGISFQYPSKYIQTYTQDTNYYALELLGSDYGTEGSDMGVMRRGTYFIFTENKTCSPSPSISLQTLQVSTQDYSIHKIMGVEGPDYKLALFKKPDNSCLEVSCSSSNFCEGDVYSDFTQILFTVKFTESKVENLGNWVKRQNGDFVTNSNCLWFSMTQENFTGNLSSYASKFYGNNPIESMLNPIQYQVKNTQTITSSAQGVGELFTIFFDKNNSKHAITFSVTSQDDVLSTPQCKNYQTDIDYVLNNVDLFI